MGRGKDKRTPENINKFHNMINLFIENERLSFVIINNIKTNYLISSKGILYRIENDKDELKVIRPYIDKDAHLRAGLHINGMIVKKYIHVLVAKAFIPNPENKPFVHHIDGDSLNNDFHNLMWVTHEDHTFLTSELEQYKSAGRGAYNPSAKYTEDQIEMVLQLMEENEKYPDEICKETGISYATFQHLRQRPESWDYLKIKYDISKYNKFRRVEYTKEQKDEFIRLRNTHPEYKLKKISKIMNIRYETIKSWNQRLLKIAS